VLQHACRVYHNKTPGAGGTRRFRRAYTQQVQAVLQFAAHTAEAPDAGEVVVKILDRVVVDFVLLQEAVEFRARADAQERAELVPGDAPLPVRFEARASKAARAGSWPCGSRGAAKSSGRVTVICTASAWRTQLNTNI
jgi:hypothetical protein